MATTLAVIQTMPLAQTLITLAEIQTHPYYTPLIQNNKGKVNLQKEAPTFESDI